MALGKLLDWSQARPNLAAVKAAGYSAVYRYVCSDAAERGLPGKRLTPAERDAILHAGLDLGLHGEDDPSAAKLGYTRGKQQGTQWADYASSVLAAPKGMTIVAAIDYDTAGTYPAVVQDYLHGVRDGFAGEYAVGVYGSFYVVEGALVAGDAVHAVQTAAWSHGNIFLHAHVYQHGPSEFPNTDYNDILNRPHGTWLQTLATPSTPGDDVKPILAKDGSGNCWVIAADLSTRTGIDPADYDKMQASGQYAPNPGIGQITLVHIPDVTQRPTGTK